MRFIQLTEEMKQNALAQFLETLNNQRSSTSAINFSFDLKNTAEEGKVIVNFTTTAWLKMWALVTTERGEIGWHGIVEKVNKGMYIIKDILMYPQYVTGTTVQTDDVGYGNWLHKELSDDEINNLRFHGHSHVNMSTSPSGVDTTWYNEILQGLGNDDFYIFGIFNKREEIFMEIYDLAENTIYEKTDITINVILEDNNYLNNWVESAKKQSLKEKPKPEVTTEKTFIDKHYSNKPLDKALEDYFNQYTLDQIKKNANLRKLVLKEVNKNAYYQAYYNVNYSRWFQITDLQRIEAAYKYYQATDIEDLVDDSKVNERVKTIMSAQRDYYSKYGYGGFDFDD